MKIIKTCRTRDVGASVSQQSDIVAELDAEQALVESNRKLIEIFEAKIKAKLDETWRE